VTAAFVLLAVVIVQTVFLVKLSDRADEQAEALRASEERQNATQTKLDGLSKQLAGVDDRTKGTLNSTAVARKALPSVFRVRAGEATGTAFAFGSAASGGGTLLITNYHVVEDAVTNGSRAATLERKSEKYPVRIIKLDERRDIAVLQATQTFPRLAPLRIDVQPGEPVIVVGAPLGLADTVTTGVVSAVRSGLAGINTKVIQFDAAISPGNSGGPVINAEGLVVGVAQAKIIEEDADGLALAIPISEVCDGLVGC
jgi:S1-C subfamily serine protease